MTDWHVVTRSVEETERLGQLLGEALDPPLVILLHGDLGSGKTALVRGLARGLGVPASEPVTSPTFALLNEYRGRCLLHHFDLYRLDSLSEVDDLGFDDYLESSGVTVVEWAERAASPAGAVLTVTLHLGAQNDERQLLFTAPERLQPLLTHLAARWEEGAP